MIDLTTRLTFTVPLTQLEHGIAEKFRRQHNDPQKQKRVYLNTLAVYAVDFYLRCLGFETDLSTSDSCDSMMRSLMDVADLEVKNIGKIECRPVMPNSPICRIPLEVWSDRIGFVAVRLSESFREATLIGFVETVTKEETPISEMRSLENLVNKLYHHSAKEEHKLVNSLWQWLDRNFDQAWQAVEELINPQKLSIVRNTKVSRAKLIDLGIDLAGYPVILIVNLGRENDRTLAVHLQAYPSGENSYLPPSLKLIVLTESGDIFKEVTARSADKFIQYQFDAERGDRFGVKLVLGDVSVTEEFVI